MEGKEIIINIKLTGDGAVDVKKLKQALSEFTKETEKNINVRKKNTQAIKGTEKAYLNEIKRIKQQRAETAKTSKDYISYTKQIEVVERQLRELTEARKTDIQVNADQISNQGLASASLTEFGRLISDAPFGIIGMTNNISQLGSQLGTLSRKTGSAKASFDLLITQLKSGGALILGFQILISLITLYRDEITDFVKGTNTAAAKLKELRKEIEETNAQFDAEGAKLIILNNIINDNTASRESQIAAADELASILPGLTAAEIDNKDAVQDNTLAIEEYITQQKARAEIDAILDANADIFAKKAKIRAIESMEEGEEKEAALKKFVKANDSFLLRIESGMRSSIQSGGLGRLPGVAKARGFFSAVLGSNATERKQIFNEISKDVDKSALEITTILTDLQEQITKPAGSGDGEGDKRDKVTAFVFGGRWKAKIGKSADEIEQFYEKTFKKILEGTDLLSADEQFKQFKENSKSVIDDISALDDKREENHQNELNRIKDEFDKRNQLADNIKSAVSKLSQIQDQAFQSQIKRLDTERDVILNNDNLSAEEKDRLLKKNDTETRKVRTKQIKFERDMHMIEMSMELAKIGLQLQNAMTEVISAGGVEVGKATMSIGSFIQKLGPFGIAAYAASIGGVIATIVSARKKAQQQIQALSNQSLAVSGGGGGAASGISAPDFNVVGATQTSQLAQTIAGAEDKPLRAYVVASDISTAQELERSTIEGASIG